ncbi:hypothetical protein [Ulvibacterium sp.]|uniref:hypothetical protein n=1 Tax=Ulvibacterium sp. TaxID=2665914 RepID=UPI0026029878|nr:hypothetical protein [Ulvibacterium sp.]
MDTSINLAAIIGPIVMAIAISEYLNFKIWRNVHPTVVYLNGLVLLIGGLIVIRMHNYWTLDWTLAITIFGWLFILLGLARMFFPTQKQLEKSLFSNLVLLLLFLAGTFLSFKAYLSWKMPIGIVSNLRPKQFKQDTITDLQDWPKFVICRILPCKA